MNIHFTPFNVIIANVGNRFSFVAVLRFIRCLNLAQKPHLGDLPSPVPPTKVTALARIPLKLTH